LAIGEIKNRKSLLSVGNKKERALILDCFDGAISSVLPRNLIEKELLVKSNYLYLPRLHLQYDLTSFQKIIVLGGGKASGYLAEGLEQKLGIYISEGYVNILRGTKKRFRTKKIVLNEASHPVPNQSGVNGTREMLKLLRTADRNCLVICLISGGGSSLIPLPAKGITLNDKIKTTELLLRSGADIDRINCVRKHISGVKGGQLVREGNGATFLSLIISDVVGDHLESIASGLTVADSSFFLDAKDILTDLKILNKVPSSVRKRIELGCKGLVPETPKTGDPIFGNVSNVIIGSNKMACEGIQQELRKRLRDSAKLAYLGSSIVGEASRVAKGLVSKSLRFRKKSRKSYAALVWGGETTVTVRGNGIGGRNQEEALSALVCIGKTNNPYITLGFFGTDGIDGETSATGALVDLSTYERARLHGLEPNKYLKENDSNTFFRRVGNSLIVTGPTGTNVNDLGIAILHREADISKRNANTNTLV
jgi:glycerate 2-kinase